jgi:hypothetical protein
VVAQLYPLNVTRQANFREGRNLLRKVGDGQSLGRFFAVGCSARADRGGGGAIGLRACSAFGLFGFCPAWEGRLAKATSPRMSSGRMPRRKR